MMNEEELQEIVDSYGLLFEQFCQAREQKGAEEYGKTTFLGNDVLRMMCEELADTANYAKMQFIKLMMMQAYIDDMADKLPKNPDGKTVTIGVEAFKGAGFGWNSQ